MLVVLPSSVLGLRTARFQLSGLAILVKGSVQVSPGTAEWNGSSYGTDF